MAALFGLTLKGEEKMAEEEKAEGVSIAGFKIKVKDFSRGCKQCGRFGMVKDKDFNTTRCIHCGTLQPQSE